MEAGGVHSGCRWRRGVKVQEMVMVMGLQGVRLVECAYRGGEGWKVICWGLGAVVARIGTSTMRLWVGADGI